MENKIDKRAQKQWIEVQSIHLLMAGAINAEIMATIAIALIAATLYQYVNTANLSLWLLASMANVIARAYTSWKFWRTNYENDAARYIHDFHLRVLPFIVIAGALWGSTAGLIMNTPPESQYLCMLIMMGAALFTVHNLSPHRSTFVIFCHTINGVWLLFVVWNILNFRNTNNYLYYFFLIIVFLLYWNLLLFTGRRLSKAYRLSLKSQYDNQQLIESLKSESNLLLQEKVIALDAVAVKRRFIASAAHDIRQPVMAMTLYADWLNAEPELVSKITPKILEASKSVNVLFESLFDLDKIESGQIHPELTSFDAGVILRELINQFSPLALAKGLELRARIKNVRIFSDQVIFRRIVSNLLVNALKYSDKGGVLLGVRKSGLGYSIEIWDTGVGIAPENKHKVFTEFFKVSKNSGTDDGFGLGLPIVKRLTALLPSADLRMRSIQNRGSVFKFYSPSAKE